MSLESYKKALEEQRERERQYAMEHQQSDKRASTKSAETKDNNPTKRTGTGMFIFLFIVVSLGVAAIVKNPTEAEARRQLKQTAIDMMQNHMNEESDDLSLTGFIATLMLPSMYDNFTKTEVTDYTWFSSFSVTTINLDENYTVSGIIVFGKIIPIKKKEYKW